jgi:glycosyltransferase involved in cell wall biosynthesis
MAIENKIRLIIVVPLFNDWEALQKLLLLIDKIVLEPSIILEMLVVDDFSTQPIPDSLSQQTYHQIQIVNILRLRRNLGHQRAIAIGLCYVYHTLDCDFVLVMDGDGEDNPFEIERLLKVAEQTNNHKIIFAKRTKRSESYTFKFFYFTYKKLYQILIGRDISVGNFSLIPAKLLKNVVVISEIWNHYSSGIYRSRIPYLEVPIPRAKRLDGKPKMNLVSLVTHGLSSIAVYGDIVGTRILLSIVALFIFLVLIFSLVIIIKFFTNWAIPGWATYVSGLLIIFIFQLILLGAVFSMIILSSRNSFNFIPIRDYKYYVDQFFQL